MYMPICAYLFNFLDSHVVLVDCCKSQEGFPSYNGSM